MSLRSKLPRNLLFHHVCSCRAPMGRLYAVAFFTQHSTANRVLLPRNRRYQLGRDSWAHPFPAFFPNSDLQRPLTRKDKMEGTVTESHQALGSLITSIPGALTPEQHLHASASHQRSIVMIHYSFGKVSSTPIQKVCQWQRVRHGPGACFENEEAVSLL